MGFYLTAEYWCPEKTNNGLLNINASLMNLNAALDYIN